MQSDMREVLRIATPTAAVGAIATLVGGLVVGGKGAIGAVVGCVVVILFMALGQLALQWVAKSMPHLFQGMGLLVYSVQLVLLLASSWPSGTPLSSTSRSSPSRWSSR